VSLDPQDRDRPAWVRHALAGEGGPIYDVARRRFEPDDLEAEARMRAGCDDFGGTPTHREPLEILCRSLEDEAGLHLVGRWRVREVLLRYLENRLRIVEALRRDPSIADEDVGAPIVVTGSPRAGTSLLHQLLALPSDARSPLAWQVWQPTPPPGPPPWDDDPRRPLADRDVRLSAALDPAFDGMHEQGADLPREDGSLMGVDLRSDLLYGHYPVPSYARWLFADDHRSAIDWHRRVLQVLQHGTGPGQGRWVLKWPGWLQVLPQLLDAHPDATVVVCHRDPLEMLSSVTSLLTTLRSCHADGVDRRTVARDQADHYAGLLAKHVADRDAGIPPAAQVVDVHFAELTADPVGVVRRVHEAAALPFGPPDAARISEWLAARPKGRHGGHQHDFGSLGLDPARERQRFAGYQRRFDVPSEV
jgi:hypothetical protein